MRKPFRRQSKTSRPSRQNARAVQTSCLDGSFYIFAVMGFVYGYKVMGLYGYKVLRLYGLFTVMRL